MFYKSLLFIAFLAIIIAFGFWALTPAKKKIKNLLACPKTGVKEVNPKGNSPCTECAKRYAGII